MTQRTQQPWATVLADDLRGLDTARRWGMAVGAAVLLLGVAVAATGWSRAAEAADRPYADLTAPLEVGVDRRVLQPLRETLDILHVVHTPARGVLGLVLWRCPGCAWCGVRHVRAQCRDGLAESCIGLHHLHLQFLFRARRGG